VTPEQVQVARLTRRFLSGDLKAPVLGFPRFSWGEASYLRAQIARIAGGTLVAPKGFYQAEGDGEDAVAQVAEDFKEPALSDLLAPEHWVHYRHHLLKQGRTKFWKEEKEEEDGAQKQPEEEHVALLGALSDDEPAGTCWTFRRSCAGSVPTPHDSVSAHSLIWPGAVTAFKGKTLCSVYVGYGQRYLAQPYSPPPPPPVQQEYVPQPTQEDKDPLTEQADPPKPAEPDPAQSEQPDPEQKEDHAAAKPEGEEEEEEEEEH